ncbi:hypothetical protein BC831DRAFT_487980 [Entophlyctis helioformis]|nr:hypothetical protein BC831DRAFT_487980 [Entophlyctis helioformis]
MDSAMDTHLDSGRAPEAFLGDLTQTQTHTRTQMQTQAHTRTQTQTQTHTQQPAAFQPRSSSLAPSLDRQHVHAQPHAQHTQPPASQNSNWSWTALTSSLFVPIPDIPALWEDDADGDSSGDSSGNADRADAARERHTPSQPHKAAAATITASIGLGLSSMFASSSNSSASQSMDQTRFVSRPLASVPMPISDFLSQPADPASSPCNPMSPGSGSDSAGTHTNDAVDAQRLLLRLERENMALAKDPRSIMVHDGGIHTTEETLHTLIVSSTPGHAADLAVDGSSLSATPSEGGISCISDRSASGHADEAFWESLLAESDVRAAVMRIPHFVSARIRQSGMPASLRKRLWLNLACARVESSAQIYPALLAEKSPFEPIIQRDIARTFPKVEMFEHADGHGQRMLFNVLKAYSIYDRDLGYCQGLSFCAGMLLMHELSEVETFALLVRFLEDLPIEKPLKPLISSSSSNMSPLDHQQLGTGQPTAMRLSYALRTCFLPDMAGLHLALYQHSELLKILSPTLEAHLGSCGITATMYASQWFLTLFSYNFPLELATRLFDLMVVEGAMLCMVRFSVGILHANQERLLAASELEVLIKLLKGSQLVAPFIHSLGALFKQVFTFTTPISTLTLEDLKSRYLQEQRRATHAFSKAEIERLSQLVAQVSLERDEARRERDAERRDVARLTKAIADLRSRERENDELSLQLRKDCQVLRARVVQLEAALNVKNAAVSPGRPLPPSQAGGNDPSTHPFFLSGE